MPAKVKVRIVAGRDLPVMDRASDLTDAFVEVKFGNTTHKTDVCRKSLNPQWNSDWYRFEVDDEDLQDEPLQIRVLDHDTYSAHDAIGKVYIDLNPLLSKEHGSVISGWFPIYDTMHGIRGELHVIVKVDLFSDFNKFRQSSCGVHFFCTSGIPHGYVMQVIFGFVEELVVNDDPEYQWIDKLRSQRASNEARQIHFTKLSGQLQRKIGLKVLEMGGNAVIGYRQCFDLEGESGVVVRGIGTSVLIAKSTGGTSSPPSSSPIKDSVFCPTTPNPRMPSPLGSASVVRRNTVLSLSPTPTSPSPAIVIHRTVSYPAVGSARSVLRPIPSARVSPSSPNVQPLVQPLVSQFGYQPLPSSAPASPNPDTPSLSSRSLPSPAQNAAKSTGFPLPTSSVSPTSPVPPNVNTDPPNTTMAPPTGIEAPPIVSAVPGVSNLLFPVQGLYGVGCSYPVPEDAVAPSSPNITPTKMSTSPAKIAVPLGRRSSESDIGTPPKVLMELEPELETVVELTVPHINFGRRASFGDSLLPGLPVSKSPSTNIKEPVMELKVPGRRGRRASFGDYGLSGSPVMKISSFLNRVFLQVPGEEYMRRASESEVHEQRLGSSLTGSSGSGSGGARAPFHRPPLQQQSIDMLEYPFFTMKSFPCGFLVHLGGVVAARSVKLLDRIHNPDEPETRDAWWTELRTEIRSHARAMGCHAVVGYSEQTTICEEIIVLSATGTAAIVNLRSDPDSIVRNSLLTMSLDRTNFEREKDKEKKLHVDVNLANQAAAHRLSQLSDGEEGGYIPQCSLSHIPYNESSLPYPVNLSHCCICRRGKVPDMLFTTIEPQFEFPVVGKGCLIQARICRPKKEARGEVNAKEISDSLPFMEYELHCQLQNKLKVKGMNALFGLKVQVVVGERMLVAVATATAVYAAAMPAPPLPKVLGKMEANANESGLTEMRKKIIEAVNRNRELYNLYPPDVSFDVMPRPQGVDVDSEDELADAEFSAGNKDTFILEIDDAEDAAVVQVLLDPPVPDGFEVCSTETMPGVGHLACNLQMFTRVWRGSLHQASNTAFASIFDSVLKSLFFKLRTMTPCCLCHLDFDVELHDEDDIQVSVTGISMGVGEPPSLTNGLVNIAQDTKDEHHKGKHLNVCDNEELMFTMDGVVDGSVSAPVMPDIYPGPALIHRAPSLPSRSHLPERRFRYYSGPKSKSGAIELTPLSHLPGGHIEYYLGHLNFFIIRETTSVRESGGLNGFMHSFIAEVMAICRAHVASLGGNALVAYQLSECVLDDNLHKNQSQCLVNVCGDVVQVAYDADLHQQQQLQPQTSGSSSSGAGGGVAQSISPLIQEARSGRRSGGTPRSSPKNSPKTDRARLIV